MPRIFNFPGPPVPTGPGYNVPLVALPTDIWALPMYRPKRLILSATVGVDKTLLYSSRMQTTCARKHNEASLDSYLAATLAGLVS